MRTIRIRLLWHAQAQFAGYLIAEHLGLGVDRGVRIVCEPIDFRQSGMQALADSAVELAVASPSHLLESPARRELRFILAIQQTSSLVYPVKVNSGIANVADLRGRRVGVWPGHEDLELRWMLLRAGLPDGSVARVPFTNTVDPLIAGTIDCAQMTCYHELHHLEESLGADAIRVFSATSYQASLLKDGLLARASWLEAHREEAQAAVDAILEGWTLAFSDAERAIDICARFRPDMSSTEHKRQLADIRRLSLQGASLTHGLGYPDPIHLDAALQAMRELGIAAPTEPPEHLADMAFWQSAPSRWRSAEWPPG